MIGWFVYSRYYKKRTVDNGIYEGEIEYRESARVVSEKVCV